jgi:AAHS family 4-hydroxybenzoate transporter-like MFS transporter
MAPSDNRVDTEELVDAAPLNAFHGLVWLLGTSVIFIDGFNIQVMGYLMPKLVEVWHLPKGIVGPIISSGLFGVFTGYLLLSPFATRIGHRRMILGCTLLVGLGTLATTWATDALTLMLLRYVTGIALGASNPSAVLVISDFVPRRVRSTFVAAAIVGVSLGSLTAGQVAILVLDRFGWQGVLWVGGVAPLALTAILFALTPDTFDVLIHQRRDQSAALKVARRIDSTRVFAPGTVFHTGGRSRSSSVAELFRSGRTVGTLSIWVAFASNLLVYYFVQSWLALIIREAGHSQTVALNATSAFLLGGSLAFLVIGPLMDRYRPFAVLLGFFIAGAAMVALLGAMIGASIPLVIALTIMLGFCVSGLQKGMHAICIHFYPTALRATGLGWGQGIGRLGAALGPILAGLLSEAHVSTAGLFYWATLPMLLGASMQWVMLRRRPDAPAAVTLPTGIRTEP